MSVIQDALRRKLVDQQREKSTRPARPVGSAVPPPTPPVAQQVLQQESMMRSELEHKYSAGSSIGTNPRPSRVQEGAGRWMLGTALISLFAILVGGVLFYMNRGVPLTAVPPPMPQPLLHQPVGEEMSQLAPEGADRWPRITVHGVLASPNAKKSSAILNGEMVFLNQKIQGARLIEVSNEGVQLRFRGKTMSLDIGSSTSDEED